MAARQVIKMGHPLLLERSKEVENIKSVELTNLIADMKDTMAALNGAGLAAPQIAVNLRVVIFGFSDNPRYPDAESVPETVLINPEIAIIDTDRESAWEGCLSIPHMRGLVPRYSAIRYRGYDENGHLIEREVRGFHARVVQHEVDHLDGVLYPARIENLKDFGFEDELFPPSEENK